MRGRLVSKSMILFALMLYVCYEVALRVSAFGAVDNLALDMSFGKTRCLSYTNDISTQDDMQNSKASCAEGFANSKLMLLSPFQTPLSKNTSLITYYDLPNVRPAAHASSLVDISSVSDKAFMLLYFAGTREGASDVGIYQSFYALDSEISESSNHTQDPAKSQSDHLRGNERSWSESRLLLDAPMLSKLSGKFVKKLGNPVGFVDMKGRTHLFVVGVSLGGWATSKIYWLMFEQDLHSLHFVKELRLSPFLNFSHLVRTPPILKDNGGFYLPIYHELARKYPLIYEVGEHLWGATLNAPLGFHTPFSKDFAPLSGQLQPSFVAISEEESFGIYRNYRGNDNLMSASVCDAFGCKMLPTNLKNYDSSSVLFSIGTKHNKRGENEAEVFLLHNETSREGGNKREELWIYRLSNTYELFAMQEAKEARFERVLQLDYLLDSEVSYPSAIVGKDGVMIAYTHGRKFIRLAFVPFEALGIRAKSALAQEEIALNSKEYFKSKDMERSALWSVISWSVLILTLAFFILQKPLKWATNYLIYKRKSPFILSLFFGLFAFLVLFGFNLSFSSSFGIWSVREYAYSMFDLPSVMSVLLCLVWLSLFFKTLVCKISESSLAKEASCPFALAKYPLVQTTLLLGLWSGFGAVVYFGFLGYDFFGLGLDIYHLEFRISLLIFIVLGLISYTLNPLVGFCVLLCLVAYSFGVMGGLSIYSYVLDPFLWVATLIGFVGCVLRLMYGCFVER